MSTTPPRHVGEEYEVPLRDNDADGARIIRAGGGRRISAAGGTPASSSVAGGASVSIRSALAPSTPGRAGDQYSTVSGCYSTSAAMMVPDGGTPNNQNLQQQQQQQQPSSSSISDQIATTAVHGTLGLLKFAGGVTMSTAGTVMAPPIHVTQQYIAPALYAAGVDYLDHVTPQRIKDWFRILRSAVGHFFEVLLSTEPGQVFRGRLVSVGLDLADILSSDASRQVVVDSMAGFVKINEALATPETKAALEQLSVLACRCVDMVSEGQTKQFVHNVSALVWSACQLLADPSTTTALAEVTAYLCHALEKEDFNLHSQQTTSTSSTPKPNASMHHNLARRLERNMYQKATYQEKHRMQDPDTSVEEVILSSLGAGAATENVTTQGDTAGASVPNNVVLEASASATTCEPIIKASVASASMKGKRQKQQKGDCEPLEPQQQHQQQNSEDEPCYQHVRRSVNGQLLKEQIAMRAVQMDRQRSSEKNLTNNHSPPSSYDYAYDEDLEDLGVAFTVKEERGDADDGGDVQEPQTVPSCRVQQQSRSDVVPTANGQDFSEDSSTTPSTIGTEADDESALHAVLNTERELDETPAGQFYRILDSLLQQERTEAVDSALLTFQPTGSRDGRVVKRKKRQETIRQCLEEAIHACPSGALVGNGRANKNAKVQQIARTYKIPIFIGLALLLSIVMAWIGFGCYGMYIWFYPHNVRSTIAASTPLPPQPLAGQEVIVRIVREIVHVDQNGRALERNTVEPTVVSEEGIDQISKCVAEAI